MAINWGYQKDRGRFYRRQTGTIRFPDSGEITVSPTGKSTSSEKIGKHKYGVKFDKPSNLKKKVSKLKEESPLAISVISIAEIFRNIFPSELSTTEDFLDLITKYFKNKIILENKNLAEITIKSPKEIETTPGTYAYLCSLFGENNINIVETLSCYTDTIFLIKEDDVGKAINLLRF